MYRTAGPPPIDLRIIDPQNNQALLYNEQSRHWENTTIDYEHIENTPTDISNESYAVVGTPPESLPNARELAVEAPIVLTDGGAGEALTLSLSKAIPDDVSNENYAVVGTPPESLPNARELAVAEPLVLTDEGAGETLTLSLSKAIPDDISDLAYVVTGDVPESLPNGRKLVAGSNVSITDDGAGSTLTVSATAGPTPQYGTNAHGFRARKFHSDEIVNGSPEIIDDWISPSSSGSFIGEHNFWGEFDNETGVYTAPARGFYDISYSLLFNLDGDPGDITRIVIRTICQYPSSSFKFVFKNVYTPVRGGTQTINGFYQGVALNEGVEVWLTARVHGNESAHLLHAAVDEDDTDHTENSVSTFSIMPRTYW